MVSDKTALVSSPINTGIRLMSLLTAIPAAKLWCQQMADISQITFVVSEAVRSNTEQAPSDKTGAQIFSEAKFYQISNLIRGQILSDSDSEAKS